jgi:tyrosyl-tRNA synthetase
MKRDKKKFDCVQMMRSIRDELNEKYLKHPELRKVELERIKRKYKFAKENS